MVPSVEKGNRRVKTVRDLENQNLHEIKKEIAY